MEWYVPYHLAIQSIKLTYVPASQKLQATTYPFIAFLALQPRRGPTANGTRSTTSSPPTLTILSRHQGRCVPASAPTSSETLTDHLSRQLLPRVSPFLERIRSTARDRDRDRILREEQDRAFQDSARRDRERIEAKMAEERLADQEKRRLEEDTKLQEDRLAREKEDLEVQEAIRMEWRRWARRRLVQPEAAGMKGALRIAIRFPGGDGRAIRQFSPDDTLTALYAYVDSQFIPPDLERSDDPESPPQGTAVGELDIEQQVKLIGVDEWWGFKLVLAYPRRELVWQANTRLAGIDGLKGGAQIVVEKIGRHSISPRGPSPNAEDDYNTESD